MVFKLKTGWKYAFFFVIGFLIALNANSLIDLETPKGETVERNSPSNWVKEEDIQVTSDSITINVKNARWAKFTDTNSMDPVLDDKSNALQIVPEHKSQLQVGDIITYKEGNDKIIHRIIEIGNDGEWYAIAKGDNNPEADPVKIRFQNIEKVVIGIIY